MEGGIVGITRNSLWRAWKEVRKELRRASVRDVVDFLEYDIDPDVWINRLRRQISAGTYEPSTPRRFSLAKSHGFSRRMTAPEIPDLVLYRAIVDYLYKKARCREHKNVYFSQEVLSSARAAAEREAEKEMAHVAWEYPVGRRSFLRWLRYDQYRKHLILKRIYPYLVITDITNFFDSVLHTHVAEAMRGFAAPPRMIGLLFFLLERLSIREDYTDSPRIGLPVDEFDCSRTLAHLVLFAHDDRLVKAVGEDAYVRWMDDQNIGVNSRAEGLGVIGRVGESLAHLHLTPNARKSKILSLSEARRHFHLDINRMLNQAEKLALEQNGAPRRTWTVAKRRALGAKVGRIWGRAKKHEGVGEWDKILRRIYRLAGLSRMRRLRSRALRDIVENPELTRRVADYMRCTGAPLEYCQFVRRVLNHEEQVYPSVSVALFESLLRIEVAGMEASQTRRLLAQLLAGEGSPNAWGERGIVHSLLVLRFGDRRSLPRLQRCFEKNLDKLPGPTVRAAAVVYASNGPPQFRVVRKAAGRWLRNQLAEMVRLIERIQSYSEVPGRYKARLNPRFDSVAGVQFLDMRSLLAAPLLALNENRQVRSWLDGWQSRMLASPISEFDKKLLRQLLR